MDILWVWIKALQLQGSKEKNNMKREGKIELYRFLACVFIMIDHFVANMQSQLSLPFTASFQFVEFFFLTTGFFTARHFDVKWDDNSKSSDILMYHLKKFVRFLPYTIPAILSLYCLESVGFLSAGDVGGFWNNLKDIVLEITYLSVFRTSGAHLFVMWFLSAMFVTLPTLILFFTLKNNKIKIVIGTIAPILFYTFAQDYTAQEPVNQMLRSFLGMMLGGTIYYVSCWVKKKDIPSIIKWILTILFVVVYILPIVFSYKNTFFSYQYVICFVLMLFLLMSDLTKLGPWHSRILGFLGDISMPIFIWHIVVFKYMYRTGFFKEYAWLQFAVGLLIVFLISILNMAITKLCKKYCKKK